MIDFVSRQAQETILDPNLPEPYKDEVVEVAVDALLKIAERRSAYNAGGVERRQLMQSDTLSKTI